MSRPQSERVRRPLGAPLRRRPKTLDAAPTLHQLGGGGSTGGVVRGARSGAAGLLPPGVSAQGETDEVGELLAAAGLGGGAPNGNAAARALARQIAERMSVAVPRRGRHPMRGSGKVRTVPYRGDADELDLEATLEVLAERPAPEENDIRVRDRRRDPRAVVLLVDLSGSMRGERALIAAATVGALAAQLQRDALGVVAFWSDAAVVLPLGQTIRPLDLVDRLLRIPVQGLTNVAFPLEVAQQQLAAVVSAGRVDARVLLLSDCVHNAGPDPRTVAAGLPRLDVLLDVSGEHDRDLGRDLAARGRGRCEVVRDHRDVGPAVSRVFGE